MKERRIDKIRNYLNNKYPEYIFICEFVLDDRLLIYCWTIKKPEKVNSYIFSLNIRLTKKRYQEIERCLGLLKDGD